MERFAAEARAAGNLSSPHIVTVHDFGRAGPEHAGAPFLVMEYLEGRALEDVLAEGSLPPVPDALDWTRQICTGLAAAHRKRHAALHEALSGQLQRLRSDLAALRKEKR